MEGNQAAALPPLQGAVKLHLPVFLLCERRKTCSWSFPGVWNGGKAAFAAFPPLKAEESLHLSVFFCLWVWVESARGSTREIHYFCCH
ncbi:hypothetical protein AAC387_Pa03g3234 [Persea americana]